MWLHLVTVAKKAAATKWSYTISLYVKHYCQTITTALTSDLLTYGHFYICWEILFNQIYTRAALGK